MRRLLIWAVSTVVLTLAVHRVTSLVLAEPGEVMGITTLILIALTLGIACCALQDLEITPDMAAGGSALSVASSVAGAVVAFTIDPHAGAVLVLTLIFSAAGLAVFFRKEPQVVRWQAIASVTIEAYGVFAALLLPWWYIVPPVVTLLFLLSRSR